MLYSNNPDRLLRKLFLSFAILCFGFFGYTQVVITGPNCVTPNSNTNYGISGTWGGSTTMNWTCSGCTFVGSSSGTPLPAVTVKWSSSGTIYLNTSNPTSNPLMSVTVGTALQVGTISNSTQTIAYNAVPATINCSAASGGACGATSYTYYWMQSSDNVNFTDITGANSQNLSFSSGLTATTYFQRRVYVSATSAVGYTSSATVTVSPQLVAGSISPASQTINYGTNASALSLSGVSGGNGVYTYQWQSAPDAGFSSPTAISGATSASYTPTGLTATTYYRVAVTSNGVTQYSTASTVNVYPQLVAGTVSPASQTINYNTVPGSLTLSGVSGGSGSYTYQWQSAPDAGFSSPTVISGATASTYAPPALTATTYYRVAVTSNGVTLYSTSTIVNVYPQLVAGTIAPAAQTINYNTAPVVLTLSGVSGGNGTFTYQWQSAPTSAFTSPTIISGATSTTYTSLALTATTYYRVAVTSNGLTLYSAISTVTVYPLLVAGTVAPATQNINYNTVPAVQTLSGVSGGSGTYTYQWQSSPTSAFTTPTIISGATAATYAAPALTATTYYRVAVTSNGITLYSAITTVTVYPQLVAGSITPATQTINYNTAPAVQTLSGVTGGSGTYTYQWQSSPISAFTTPTIISGATATTYTASALTATTYYRVAVTSNGLTLYSAMTTVNVYPQLVAGTISPASQTINYNTAPAVQTLSGVSGGNSTFTYQWQSSPTSAFTSPTIISGATATTYTAPALTATTYYRVAVTSNGVTLYSALSTVTVYPLLVAGTIAPSTQNINYNTAPAVLTLSGVSGGSGTYTYQWQSAPTSAFTSPTVISGATATTYTAPALTATTYYRVAVTSNGVTLNSAITTVTVYPQLAAGTVAPATQTINYNTNAAVLTLSGVTGGNGVYTYQWQSSTTSGFSSPVVISGATSTTYTPTSLTATKYYRVAVTSNGLTLYSAITTVNVYPQLVAGTITPATQAINYNAVPATLTLTGVSGGSGAYTYQWQSSSTSGFASPVVISGATSTTYAAPALTSTMYYRVVVTSNGISLNSAITTVTVYPQLVAGSLSPSTQTINYNKDASVISLSGVSGGSGTYTYQWQYSATSGFTNPAVISGANSTTYTALGLLVTTYYRVAVTSNGATLYSGIATVNVNQPFLPGAVSPASINIATGTSPGAILANPASGGSCSGSYAYQWQSSADGITYADIAGATSATYTPGNLSVNTWFRRKVTCGTDIAYTNACAVGIGVATNLNYIRVRVLTRPGITANAASDALTDPNDVKQVTQYYDGLGRTIQQVGMQLSPKGKDVVALQVYDVYGRESVKFLPYIAATSDGNYKVTAIQDQNTFNTAQFPGEQYYFGQTNFEPAPINRAQTILAPGSNWIGSNRGIDIQYQVNQSSDSVRYWTIASASGSIPTTTSTYPAGTLLKNIITDEGGHKVIEYKDMQGHTVLKKVQLSDNPGTAHMGWLSTYYVFDDLNNIRFIIQPKAIDLSLLNGTWNLTSIPSLINELCFRYEYDNRKRLIINKIPGTAEVWMVYDSRDRLVITQDSILRSQQKWAFTKYDGLNRPDSTGTITDPVYYNNSGYHQNLASASINYPNVASYTNELLAQTFYDNYNWASSQGLLNVLNTTYNSNASYFNTNYNTSPVYAQAISQFPCTRGMVTGSSVKVLGTVNQFLPTVSFYDDHARVVQLEMINQTGGKDTAINQYDFSGKVIRSLLRHQKLGTNVQTHSVLTKFNFDPTGRIVSIFKNIDNAGTDQLLSTGTYNELDQLQNKQLGNSLDSLVYSYNIRGWLSSINKQFISGSSGNYFGMELGYDKASSVAGTTTYTNAQYNGNIAGTVWKTAGDGVGRKYDFVYDNVNRLTAANFVQNTTGSTWDNGYIDFTTSKLSYDGNGNIMTMNQKGFKVGGSATIDSLFYIYQTNSNKLSQVNELANDPISKLGDFHFTGTKQSTDYTYDGNGNMLTDNNKAISAINYNFLNQPQAVTITGKGTINYVYDAAGNKLYKTTVDTTVSPAKTTTNTYIGSFVYQACSPPAGGPVAADTLQFIANEEGRARWAYHKYTTGYSAYGFEYDFYEKDHLGNTRVILTQQKDTAKYLASMEGAFRNTEIQLFNGIINTVYPRNTIPGYPANISITNPNDSVSRLNGNGPRVGPSIILKVMSGDKLDIGVQSFFNGTGSALAPVSSFDDVLNSLVSGIVQMTAGGKGTTAQLIDNTGPVYTGVSGFLPSHDSTPANKPKAYLNWILFDEQLKYVSSYPQSGAIQVGSAGVLSPLAVTGIPITKNGFLYIWVSNETPNWDVYFDNLSVVHYTGPELEETHYYPFGLTMAGISSRAFKPKYAKNNFRYNTRELQNQEFSDGSGLEEYDFIGRHYDPQIGRWHNIDNKAGSLPQHSPYEYCINNPVLFVDPDGQFPYPIHIRSFAPFVTFGGGFGGDNRGWSTTLGKEEVSGGVTSRMQQTFTIDPSQKTITGLKTWSDPSSHPWLGSAKAQDRADVKAGFKNVGDNKVGIVTSNMAANLPLIPSADIDIHSAIRLTENVKTGNLNIQMSMDGDKFPAAEAFIGDSKGQQVFMGVSPYEGGPYTSLPGNNDRPMFYINFDIKINDKGEFTGVVSNGQTYSVDDWNKQVKSTPLEYQDAGKSKNSNKNPNIFDFLNAAGIQWTTDQDNNNQNNSNSGANKKWQLYGVY